tara:strand:+ start:8860 stop:11436 length:2577 start_codon:yes stop_codon:yes gene_type:complete
VKNNLTENQYSNKLYKPSVIEKKCRDYWKRLNLYKTNEIDDTKNKFYALSMFPYPSGNLHMGHVRNYVITDLIARYQTLKGKNVLHPMGWDAFGLPAENAAIERNINPRDWTSQNISHMKNQLEKLGLSVDWDKEFATCDEEYYKWTQFLFLELFKSGLVYQKESEVNWDPIDNTVLANEQVDSEGKSWRSGAVVEKKLLKQWFLKITNYADELLKDLNTLDDWPERVKTMQENWIGKSYGTDIIFSIKESKLSQIKVFTTRADTLYGVTYLAVSHNHELINDYKDLNFQSKIKKFRKHLKNNDDKKKDKFGFDTGLKAINPLNNDQIPIWIASYVLDDYGTGAVMGVPAHDQRDYQFAVSNNIIIKQVISKSISITNDNLSSAFEDDGYLINSNQFNGLDNKSAKNEITKFGNNQGWAKQKIQYRLKDWLISRQRYWGCPIPIVHCMKCGSIPIKQNELPVKLPNELNSNTDNLSTLNDNKNWLNIKCPKCASTAKRETDTMDTFMCSSWYFLRYTSSNISNRPFDKEKVNKWLPVDQYVGGVEHAILHLLYARFLTKALRDNSLFNINEPFKKLLTQGMVQAAAYKNLKTGKYVSPKNIKDLNNPLDPNDGSKLQVVFEKMSKSKYNGIDPDTVIKKYGADTARMFILFKAPPEKDLEWGDSDVEGQYRFLSRIWKLYNEYIGGEIPNNQEKINPELDKKFKRIMNIAIKEISIDIEKNQFNTAISELMKFYNAISKDLNKLNSTIIREGLINFAKLLSPFAPHLSEELWSLLGFNRSIHKEAWPEIDLNCLINENYQLVIQINGKVRDKITIPTDSSEEEMKQICLESKNIQKWINEKPIKKFIVVKGRIINLVI